MNGHLPTRARARAREQGGRNLPNTWQINWLFVRVDARACAISWSRQFNRLSLVKRLFRGGEDWIRVRTEPLALTDF